MKQPKQQPCVSEDQLESSAQALQPDEFAARFKVLSKLGSGAFADVFQVRDNVSNRDCALKVLRPSAPNKAGGLKPEGALFKEAQALNHAKHKNILGIVEFLRVPLKATSNNKPKPVDTSSAKHPHAKHSNNTARSRPATAGSGVRVNAGSSNKGSSRGSSSKSNPSGFSWALLLDFAQCGSLSKMVLRQMIHPQLKVYSDLQALTWAVDIAEGLEHMHGLQPMIIHRDLKLENILLQRPPPTADSSSAGSSSSSSRKLPVAKISDMGLHVMVDKQQQGSALLKPAGVSLAVLDPDQQQQQQSADNLDSSSSSSSKGSHPDLFVGHLYECGKQPDAASSSSDLSQLLDCQHNVNCHMEQGAAAAAAAARAMLAATAHHNTDQQCPVLVGGPDYGMQQNGSSVIPQRQQQQQSQPEHQISSLYIAVADAAACGSNGGSTDAAVEITFAADATDDKAGHHHHHHQQQQQQQQRSSVARSTLQHPISESDSNCQCSDNANNSSTAAAPETPQRLMISSPGLLTMGLPAAAASATSADGGYAGSDSSSCLARHQGMAAVGSAAAAAASAGGAVLVAVGPESDCQMSPFPGLGTGEELPAVTASKAPSTALACDPTTSPQLQAVSKLKAPSTALAYDLTRYTGSCMYMAPEVYRGKPYNESIDVFSLGVMLYELFSRTLLLYTHTPASSPSDSMRYAQRVSGGYRPKCPKSFSKEIWHIIERCWSQDASARPSAAWVRQQLQELRDAEEAAVTTAAATGGLRGMLQWSKGDGSVRPLEKDAAASGASAPSSLNFLLRSSAATTTSNSSDTAGKMESRSGMPVAATGACSVAPAANVKASEKTPHAARSHSYTAKSCDRDDGHTMCGCIIC